VSSFDDDMPSASEAPDRYNFLTCPVCGEEEIEARQPDPGEEAAGYCRSCKRTVRFVIRTNE
jgi:hypothetical protein